MPRPTRVPRTSASAALLMFLVRYSGTGVVVGLFLLSKWGFVRSRESRPESSKRMLIINPSFYYSLSKQARRGVIAHEIAHQYDQASRERLVTDLGIFVPSGIADAAIVLDLLGRVQLDG